MFALDLDGLRSPDVTLWTAWDGEAAHELYRRAGFRPRGPFGAYTDTEFSTSFTRSLTDTAT